MARAKQNTPKSRTRKRKMTAHIGGKTVNRIIAESAPSLSAKIREYEREMGKVHRMVLRRLDDPRKVAELLHEYNRWRRGEGKYAWKDNPADTYIEPPFPPKTLGRIIDVAARFLEGCAVMENWNKNYDFT